VRSHTCHLYGDGLGGFLALLYAQVRARGRVRARVRVRAEGMVRVGVRVRAGVMATARVRLEQRRVP
jgi:hypothetical protein